MGADNFEPDFPLDPRHGHGGYTADEFWNGYLLENKPDLVNHPPHYQTKNGLETIDVIEAFTDGLEGIEAVCAANVIKYICRWNNKNGLQDLLKCRWYLNKLIDVKSREEGSKNE